MAIVQISKIQVRTGAESDLPQLDIGEIGFTTDNKNAYIGNDPLLDPPVGIQPTLTQILTDSPNCYINASQLTGIINVDTGNIKISGGVNGYVLQTDGNGNLSWTAGGGGGSGSPGGSNTQIQFNDSGSFGGSTKLTFNKSTNTFSVTGNISATNINGNLTSSAQPNITSLGTLTGLTTAANANVNVGGELKITNNNQHGGSDYAGMITLTTTISGASNTNKFIRLNKTGNLEIINSDYSTTIFSLTDSGNLYSNYFFGNGSQLTGVRATSVDTLYGLTVDGVTTLGTVSNVKITGGTSGQVLTTDGAGNLSWGSGGSSGSYSDNNVRTLLAAYTDYIANAVHANVADLANSITGNNVTGYVANAVVANTVRASSQPNITSVGTLTSLTITGNITGANIVSANYFVGAGNNLSNIRGPNVNGFVAYANYANFAGNATIADIANTALVAGNVTTASQPNITSVGALTSLNVTGSVTAGNLLVGSNVAMLSNIARTVWVSSSAPTSGQGSVGDIWYQTF